MTREEVLSNASKCVNGHREEEYGNPEDNFKVIAKFWSTYLDKEISSEDVAAMMALLKIARIKGGNATDDSWIDLAGYAACGGEITSNKNLVLTNENQLIFKDETKIKIPLLHGQIIAERNPNPDYDGVTVYYENERTKDIVKLVLIESPVDAEKEKINIRVFGNAYDEDCSDELTVYTEDIHEALDIG